MSTQDYKPAKTFLLPLSDDRDVCLEDDDDLASFLDDRHILITHVDVWNPDISDWEEYKKSDPIPVRKHEEHLLVRAEGMVTADGLGGYLRGSFARTLPNPPTPAKPATPAKQAKKPLAKPVVRSRSSSVEFVEGPVMRPKRQLQDAAERENIKRRLSAATVGNVIDVDLFDML